jgi:TfoX/Sxy family transcriptional regulator of competence genes
MSELCVQLASTASGVADPSPNVRWAMQHASTGDSSTKKLTGCPATGSAGSIRIRTLIPWLSTDQLETRGEGATVVVVGPMAGGPPAEGETDAELVTGMRVVAVRRGPVVVGEAGAGRVGGEEMAGEAAARSFGRLDGRSSETLWRPTPAAPTEPSGYPTRRSTVVEASTAVGSSTAIMATRSFAAPQCRRRIMASLSVRPPGHLRCAAVGHAFLTSPDGYGGAVAYDGALADRLRELLAVEGDLSEMKMFGGLAFLVGGHMAVVASGQGGIMVRVDPATSDKLVATTGAHVAEMRGRPMPGWLRIDSDAVRTTRELAEWVRRGTTYARSLPPKRSSGGGTR